MVIHETLSYIKQRTDTKEQADHVKLTDLPKHTLAVGLGQPLQSCLRTTFIKFRFLDCPSFFETVKCPFALINMSLNEAHFTI